MRPELTVPPLVDFGVVQPGVVEQSVCIKNWSLKPITVTEVRSNCGCTVVDLSVPTKLRFGDSTRFNVALDVTNAAGPVEKKLLVLTDQENDEGRLVVLRALVDRSLKPQLVPAHCDLGSFGAWEPPEKQIRLDYAGPGDLRPRLPERMERGIQIDPLGREGQSFLYRLRLTSTLPLGPFAFRVPIETERGGVALEVMGTKRASLYCRDDFLVVPVGKGPARKELRLRFDPKLKIDKIALRSNAGEIADHDIKRSSADACSVFFTFTPRPGPANKLRDYIDVLLPGNSEDVSLRVPFLLAPNLPKGP